MSNNKPVAMRAVLAVLVCVSACRRSDGRTLPYRVAHEPSATAFVFPLARAALVIPFPVGGACSAQEVFESIDMGIAVDGVSADGEQLTAERLTTFAVDDPTRLPNTTGFIYLRHGNVLDSFGEAAGRGKQPTVSRYTIPIEDEFVTAKSIEIRYRVRCPSGVFSSPMIVRGSREDVVRAQNSGKNAPR